MMTVNNMPSFVQCVDVHFVAAPTRESQASDALLAAAMMQPLPAVDMKRVAEQETEELKNEVSI